MMSSHTQESMISGMVHKQWGTLLTGASVARALTYVLMYLRPPRDVMPSRPPTELLAAFGLVSGGVVFMASVSFFFFSSFFACVFGRGSSLFVFMDRESPLLFWIQECPLSFFC